MFLVSDEGPLPVARVAPRRRPPRAPVAPAAPRAPVVVMAAPADAPVASASAAAPAMPTDPRDLARLLPDPAAADALAAALRDPDTTVAVAAAEALGRTREGRMVLLAHLARPVDSPGLDHLACLEALAEFGRVEDLPTVMPWTAREDAVGDLAGWCVRTICKRERVDVPADLRPRVPELDAEVRSSGA